MSDDLKIRMPEWARNMYNRLVALINAGGGGGGGGGEENVIEAISFNGANVPPDANKRVSMSESDPTVPSWAKQSSKPTYTAQEVGALPASTTIPSKTSDLTNDSGFLTSSTGVTGVKGNAESNYRKGNVNLTPANIGAASSSEAIKSISRSGTTFTATRCDNTTFTFTQQDNNTTYSFSDKNATLSWGTKSTIATVGGTDIHVTMPSNPNTDHYAWSDITGKPSNYPGGCTGRAGSVAWGDVTSKPANYPGGCTGTAGGVAWGNITGKPAKYPADPDSVPYNTKYSTGFKNISDHTSINVNSSPGNWTILITDNNHGTVPFTWAQVTQFDCNHSKTQIATYISIGLTSTSKFAWRVQDGATWSAWKTIT